MTEEDVFTNIIEETINKTNLPQWQELGIEPKEGGKSLLTTTTNNKKTINNKTKTNKKELKTIELGTEPVLIKATPTATTVDDDKFIPPKSNFVAVGQEDHSWYPESVTGVSLIDNNEIVDVEKLQILNKNGEKNNLINPLESKLIEEDQLIQEEDKVFNAFKKQLLAIREFSENNLKNISEISELNLLKNKLFGNKKLFYTILKSIPDKNKDIITKFIKDEIGYLYNLFNYYEEQLTKHENEENEENEEEEFQLDIFKNFEYIIIVDNLITKCLSRDDVLKKLRNLILIDEIDVSRITLIKNVPIDFGIILKD